MTAITISCSRWCSNSAFSRVSLDYFPFASTEQWLKTQDLKKMKHDFDRDGVLVVENIIDPKNLPLYANLYSKMLSGSVDTSAHRHDLGSYIEKPKEAKEHVLQIMWPSLYFNYETGPLHSRVNALAKELMGPDMAIDFDHLIYKAPHSDNPFPWHQDEGYWRIGMKGLVFPDLRATSVWVALDNADEENGCMWMIPTSHKMGYFEHRRVKEGHHTVEVMGIDHLLPQKKAYPIKAGSAVLNTGRTLHYTGGNVSSRDRKAFIVNCRPQKMIDFERNNGFDHAKEGMNAFKQETKTA